MNSLCTDWAKEAAQQEKLLQRLEKINISPGQNSHPKQPSQQKMPAEGSSKPGSVSSSENDSVELSKAEASLLQKVVRKGLIVSKHDLEVQRKDPTSPLYSVKTFEALHLKPQLLKGVYEMGFNAPSKIQEIALPTLLADPDDRNSLENEVSRVSSPVGVDRDEGLIAFMRTMMNSLNEKMDKNNEELKKTNEELRRDLNEKMDKNNEKMDKNNEELKKNNEELRDLNYKIDQNNEELKTEIQRSNEQLKRDMEQMRGELNNKIVEITEAMRVEINKDLKNLEEGVRLEINEQAEKNKGERSKLKSQVRGEITTEIKKLKDKREEDMREIEKRFVHIEDDKKKIDQRLEKINKRFKTRLDELNGRVDRDRANLELDQDTENGKASRDVENKSVTGSSLQEIEDMGNRVEKSLNKRLDETLGKLENKQTQLENMMRNQSMVGMRISQPANAEIFLLEFDPIKNNVHPMEFLEACKKYIEKNGEGWDFQKKFEKELMGNGTYRVGFDNLVTYVLEFYNKSQYLETRIDMGTFLAYISKHVPRTISSAIAAAQNVERSEDLENLLNQLNILNSDTYRSYDRSFDMRNETTLNKNVNQYKNLGPRDTPYRGTQVRGNIRGNNLTRVGSYYNRDTYNRERVEFENDRRRQSNNRGRDTNDYGKEKERYENNETKHQRDQYEYTRGRGKENRMENKWVGQARMKETIEKKEPNFEGYQMIGDSQLRRFGEKIMNLRGEYREKGGKRINLCIGGQTIEQLTRELKHSNNLEKQLIVMIGTNDLLRDKEVKSICNDYDKLVEVLLEKGDEIILVTIPPIPKLGENDRYHLNKLERMNEHIKSKENNEKVTVLEVAEKYYDNYDSTDCNVKLYEKEIFYKGKWCEDLIHLNKEGLTILANELRNLIRSDKKKSGLRLGILGRINKEEYHMIIDLGSQATIMSEKYYNEIKERSVLEILELPVTNLSIIGVTGIRSKKIDKQVMIEVEIENKVFQINFLVVKAVNLGIILGCDFLREHNAKIDFEHGEIKLEVDKEILNVEFTESNSESEDIVNGIKLIRCNYINTLVSEDELKNSWNNIEFLCKTHTENMKDKVNDEKDKQVLEILEHCEVKENEDLNKLKSILMKNKDIFSDEPGCIKNYEAK
ncbi:ATP-dependent RNA helicase ddx25 [Homalodisca vitripennis]|nr:ATP-dependent RNA helicase ddx25 [Homalodisca vitripennis]